MGDKRKIIGWKAIAVYLGMSEWATKRMFLRARIQLPKVGAGGRTSPVYLLRGQLLSAALARGLIGRKCS